MGIYKALGFILGLYREYRGYMVLKRNYGEENGHYCLGFRVLGWPRIIYSG